MGLRWTGKPFSSYCLQVLARLPASHWGSRVHEAQQPYSLELWPVQPRVDLLPAGKTGTSVPLHSFSNTALCLCDD